LLHHRLVGGEKAELAVETVGTGDAAVYGPPALAEPMMASNRGRRHERVKMREVRLRSVVQVNIDDKQVNVVAYERGSRSRRVKSRGRRGERFIACPSPLVASP
jgi:hypothetical protein